MSTSELDVWRTWNSLPLEIQDLILSCLDLTELFKARRVCKSFREVLFRDSFKQACARRRTEVTTPGRAGFQVIAAGSAAVGKGYVSRKTEDDCSVKRRGGVVGDVPGEEFSLNDYQTGVYFETQNLLLCTGFMEDGSRGIRPGDE